MKFKKIAFFAIKNLLIRNFILPVHLFLSVALLAISTQSMAACNTQDIPLGSGITSIGTSIDKIVANQNANGTGGPDGRFIYEFTSNGSPARCGRHADGTWWLAPAQGQNKVTITQIRSSNTLIKAEDNPDPVARGFLNNAEDYGNHDASNNIIPRLPIDYPLNNDATTSIFSAIQRDNGCGTDANENECIEYADFLTIYQSAPQNGGKNTIRPTIFGTNKQIYTWSDFDRTRIPNFAEAQWDYNDRQVLDLVSKWTATTEGFSIPFCDPEFAHCTSVSEGGRAFRSHAVIDDYATGGQQNRTLSYLLNSSSDVIDDTEDSALLAAVIAYGIDIITLVGAPPSSQSYGFNSGAGQFMNAANFSYFTAALSSRGSFLWNTMAVDARSLLDESTIAGPQEMQQVYDSGNGPVWGDGNPVFSELNVRRHWTEMVNGLTHDNSDNWYIFTTETAGTTFQVRDDATGRVVPAVCNIDNDDDGFCRNSTVLVGNQFMYIFDYSVNGSNIILNDPVPAGTTIQISPITERYQGWLGGNRAAGDPYGYIDGPPGVPGSGYFQVSNQERIQWAGIAQAIPELCEVINYPPMFQFVERYVESGLRMANDPCAPPSPSDLNTSCDVFKSANCVDYGLVNNGTARWGPDPRDTTQCIHNNTVLTRQANGSWLESFEARGDTGRYSRLDGFKHSNLPNAFSRQYLAFRGNRSCASGSTLIDEPLSIGISKPVNNQSFQTETTIDLVASITGPNGSVSRVDFYVNDALIGSDLEAPYTVKWTPNSEGRYTITTRAINHDSTQLQSTPVVINIVDDDSLCFPIKSSSGVVMVVCL